MSFFYFQIAIQDATLRFVAASPGGFPGSSGGKESACNTEDLGLILGLGRSPGGAHGNPLQYSCLEDPMDRGACWVTVQRVTKSWTRLKWLSATKPQVDQEKSDPAYGHLCSVFWLTIYSFDLTFRPWLVTETAASSPITSFSQVQIHRKEWILLS